MPRPDHRPHSTKLDPPVYAFVLILLSAVVQVIVLNLVDSFFKSTGVRLDQLDFAISRFIAELANFIGSPAGMVAAVVAAFAWCRFTGCIIRWMMARSVPKDVINGLVEPLMILMNMAFFGLIGAGWFLAVAHVCYTFS